MVPQPEPVKNMKVVKYTEHLTQTTAILKQPDREKPGSSTRTLRISVTDSYATDSSSDESDAYITKRQRVKKFINEVRIQPRDNGAVNGNAKTNGRLTVGKRPSKKVKTESKCKKVVNGKKFRGVRQRPWGKFAAEIREPQRRVRLWLGTYDTAEEAAMVYDHAAIKLHGPHALTNFSCSPSVKECNEASSAYNSCDESVNTVKSPKSVLGFVESQAEVEMEAQSLSNETLLAEDEKLSIFPLSDGDLFSGLENPVPVPDLFVQNGLSGELFGMDFGHCSDMLIGSDFDVGFGFGYGYGYGPSTWQTEDYFQDFGDLFGSDPLATL